MQKILLCALVFVLGLAMGGGLRYSQVEAQFSSVEATGSIVPAAAPLGGNGGGGSCG